MRFFAVLTVVGLLGCSDETIGPDPDTTTSSGNSMGGNGQGGANAQGLGYVEGSRLKAKLLTGDDGASQFYGWRDTELDLDCSFRMTPDGLRCLPQGPWVQATYFADAACTVPAAPQNTCDPAPTHVQQYADPLCSSEGVRIFRAGPKLSTAYQSTDGETCTEIGASQNAYYAAEDEVAASAFVAGSID